MSYGSEGGEAAAQVVGTRIGVFCIDLHLDATTAVVGQGGLLSGSTFVDDHIIFYAGYALDGRRFQAEIEQALGRRAAKGKAGRPKAQLRHHSG